MVPLSSFFTGGGTDSTSLSWGEASSPLSGEHVVFALDLPGYGQSDKPYLPYTTDYYVVFEEAAL